MKGKLILIEGTDCSGKETQANKLVEKLNKDGIKTVKVTFPNYDTPTGKIIEGPYLGKDGICNSFFTEGAINVSAKVSSLYFAADREYNRKLIEDNINNGINVVLDRYIDSNKAYQCGKIKDKEERMKMYEWIDKLEYDLLELPKPEITILLYMPEKISKKLKKNRLYLDEYEKSDTYLLQIENTYLEMANLYNYKVINCTRDNEIRTIDDISDELYNYVKEIV